MAKWLPPYGFTCKVHHMEAKVGGSYRMSFTNFTTGQSHSFGGEYRELVPFERIRYTDSFDDPNLPGEMQTTVTLKQVSCGTDLSMVQEGIPEVIPVEMCYLGWQESLAQLAHLVEPDILRDEGGNRRAKQRVMPGDIKLDLSAVVTGVAAYVALAGWLIIFPLLGFVMSAVLGAGAPGNFDAESIARQFVAVLMFFRVRLRHRARVAAFARLQRSHVGHRALFARHVL